MNTADLAWKVLPKPILARVEYWEQYRWFGEWELHELPRLARADGLTIDIGANAGYYSYALKRLGKEVVSFEPDPFYETRLRALLGRDARVEQVALSDSPGTSVMRVPHLKGAYGGTLASLSDNAVPDDAVSSSYEVELRTLDSYGFDDVAFIKIDVEGHEEAVLAGALDTIERSKPVLLIEIEERHNVGGLQRIVETLTTRGYSGFYHHQRKRYDLSTFVPEVHQDQRNIDNGHSNRRKLEYVNNFVFEVEPGR